MSTNKLIVALLLLFSVSASSAYDYPQLKDMKRFGRYVDEKYVSWYHLGSRSTDDTYYTISVAYEGMDDCHECLLTFINDIDCDNNYARLKLLIIHRYDSLLVLQNVTQQTKFMPFNDGSIFAKACRDIHGIRR